MQINAILRLKLKALKCNSKNTYYTKEVPKMKLKNVEREKLEYL